jgi:hypothetical protein
LGQIPVPVTLSSFPPKGGWPADGFQPGTLQAINFWFRTWLFPAHAAEKHAVEIEDVWLE